MHLIILFEYVFAIVLDLELYVVNDIIMAIKMWIQTVFSTSGGIAQ